MMLVECVENEMRWRNSGREEQKVVSMHQESSGTRANMHTVYGTGFADERI